MNKYVEKAQEHLNKANLAIVQGLYFKAEQETKKALLLLEGIKD